MAAAEDWIGRLKGGDLASLSDAEKYQQALAQQSCQQAQAGTDGHITRPVRPHGNA